MKKKETQFPKKAIEKKTKDNPTKKGEQVEKEPCPLCKKNMIDKTAFLCLSCMCIRE